MITHFRIGTAALAALAMAGCGTNLDESPAGVEETETPTPQVTPDEGVSIIRDDIAIERELPPLEPLEQRISFDDGGADLGETAIAELETLLTSRQMEEGGAIELRGHTDSSGFDQANIRASQKRAEAVRDWLTGKEISEQRIAIIALGEQNPARPNANPDGSPNEENRAFNRRVEVLIKLPPELEDKRQQAPQTLVEQVTAKE